MFNRNQQYYLKNILRENIILELIRYIYIIYLI